MPLESGIYVCRAADVMARGIGLASEDIDESSSCATHGADDRHLAGHDERYRLAGILDQEHPGTQSLRTWTPNVV